MSRFRRFAVAATIMFLAAASQARAGLIFNPYALETPDGQGDQVIFYFDAREGFTTFINVRNADGLDELQVRILFYTGGFSVPFEQELTLAPNALRVLDVGALRDGGLPAQPGIALAFAVNDGGSPVVTRALTGNFTVANLATNSAWGAAGAARSAIEVPDVKKASAQGETGKPSGFIYFIPERGTLIDGTNVFLQPIQPTQLDLSTYYDPDDLAPVADSGNQLIFVSFVDVAEPYSAAPSSTLWELAATSTDGSQIAETTFGASGVTVTDLASVAGTGVNGSSGAIRFYAEAEFEAETRLIYFAEALGTFGTGYQLPTPSVPLELLQ